MDERRALMWLQVLGNLTFSHEGQKMLLKVPGGSEMIQSFSLFCCLLSSIAVSRRGSNFTESCCLQVEHSSCPSHTSHS